MSFNILLSNKNSRDVCSTLHSKLDILFEEKLREEKDFGIILDSTFKMFTF